VEKNKSQKKQKRLEERMTNMARFLEHRHEISDRQAALEAARAKMVIDSERKIQEDRQQGASSLQTASGASYSKLMELFRMTRWMLVPKKEGRGSNKIKSVSLDREVICLDSDWVYLLRDQHRISKARLQLASLPLQTSRQVSQAQAQAPPPLTFVQANRHLQDCLARDESYYVDRFLNGVNGIGSIKLPISIQRLVVAYRGHPQSQPLFGIDVDGPFEYSFAVNLQQGSDTFFNLLKGAHRGVNQARLQEYQARCDQARAQAQVQLNQGVNGDGDGGAARFHDVDTESLKRRTDGAFEVDNIKFHCIEEVPLSAAGQVAPKTFRRIVCHMLVQWFSQEELDARNREQLRGVVTP
jgi:hypothetical protein